MSSGNERYGYQAGSQIEEPYNPSSEYAEVQGNMQGAQSTAADEAEAGVKLVPRPEDVTSFESGAEANTRFGGVNERSGDAVGRSQDFDDRQREQREREVSGGQSDQRRSS